VPRKCNLCDQKKIVRAYHVLCDDCASDLGVCAKCRDLDVYKSELELEMEMAQEEVDLEEELDGLPLRVKRSILRKREKAAQKKENGDDEKQEGDEDDIDGDELDDEEGEDDEYDVEEEEDDPDALEKLVANVKLDNPFGSDKFEFGSTDITPIQPEFKFDSKDVKF
jgi:hypothetical protein